VKHGDGHAVKAMVDANSKKVYKFFGPCRRGRRKIVHIENFSG